MEQVLAILSKRVWPPKLARSPSARAALQTHRTYWKKTVKMSILHWRRRWFLVGLFKHKAPSLFLTAHTQRACPAGAKLSSEAELAHSTATSLCPSSSPREENTTQRPSFHPCSLLAAGEVNFPLAWVMAGDKQCPPGSCPSVGLCAAQSHLAYVCLILTLNTDAGFRKLPLQPYKRKDRFIVFLIYATLGDNLTP